MGRKNLFASLQLRAGLLPKRLRRFIINALILGFRLMNHGPTFCHSLRVSLQGNIPTLIIIIMNALYFWLMVQSSTVIVINKVNFIISWVILRLKGHTKGQAYLLQTF